MALTIRATLPASYHELQQLKKDNYPYKRTFQAFMESVARLQEREGLSFYATIGRIEYAFADKESWRSKEPIEDDKLVKLEYREESPLIRQFYEKSGLPNKRVTIILIQLMLRLAHAHGTSVLTMIYLVDTLENDIAQPVKAVPHDVVLPSEVAAKLDSKDDDQWNASQTRKLTEDELADSIDRLVESVKSSSATGSTPSATAVTPSETPESTTEVEDKRDDKSPEAGDAVVANPLMSDFFG